MLHMRLACCAPMVQQEKNGGVTPAFLITWSGALYPAFLHAGVKIAGRINDLFRYGEISEQLAIEALRGAELQAGSWRYRDVIAEKAGKHVFLGMSGSNMKNTG
ncbi:hypothetical protein ALP92_01346 [Pseudomonas syringae pv. primulae]|uniref:Uncharacterized protein n=1 Tax=Pseudomonas syringae pv. primulae TaxID=251707 RepID=A0A3M4SEE8_9PSED|nr:hypothetical protein ALP92_01346 [Pseudomonas syringae pv. primulae]